MPFRRATCGAILRQPSSSPASRSLADVIAGCHCMTPSYLLNQLDCSLRNLDLECVDIYYVHNPETQLGKITRQEFSDRLLRAFEALEMLLQRARSACTAPQPGTDTAMIPQQRTICLSPTRWNWHQRPAEKTTTSKSFSCLSIWA